jgi:hypothetical protein
LVVGAHGVDRHDPGMLEPARDLGLQQKPSAAVGVVGTFRLNLLERDLALQLDIKCHRNFADAPLCVWAEHVNPHTRGCGCA